MTAKELSGLTTSSLHFDILALYPPSQLHTTYTTTNIRTVDLALTWLLRTSSACWPLSLSDHPSSGRIQTVPRARKTRKGKYKVPFRLQEFCNFRFSPFPEKWWTTKISVSQGFVVGGQDFPPTDALLTERIPLLATMEPSHCLTVPLGEESSSRFGWILWGRTSGRVLWPLVPFLYITLH